MKVKAIKAFFDSSESRMVEKDEVFEVTAKRLSEINGTEWGTLAVAAETMLETPELKKKKPTRR